MWTDLVAKSGRPRRLTEAMRKRRGRLSPHATPDPGIPRAAGVSPPLRGLSHDAASILGSVADPADAVRAGPGGAGHLFVANHDSGSVLEYDGTTGAFVKTFASGGGLSLPQALVFAPNGDLLVGDSGSNTVLEFNGTTGAFVRTFASDAELNGPLGLVFGPKGDLFVSSASFNTVLEFNGTRAPSSGPSPAAAC